MFVVLIERVLQTQNREIQKKKKKKKKTEKKKEKKLKQSKFECQSGCGCGGGEKKEGGREGRGETKTERRACAREERKGQKSILKRN